MGELGLEQGSEGTLWATHITGVDSTIQARWWGHQDGARLSLTLRERVPRAKCTNQPDQSRKGGIPTTSYVPHQEGGNPTLNSADHRAQDT